MVNKELFGSIERVEGRAYGILLVELATHLIDVSEARWLQHLAALCLQPVVDTRPSFADLVNELIQMVKV